MPDILLATPNLAEAATAAGGERGDRPSMADVAAWGRRLAEQWHARSVAITLSERGALLVGPDGPPMAVPAAPSLGTDPCGAGDRFAAAAATALLRGALPSEAVGEAVVAATAFVDAGGARVVLADGTPSPADLPGDARALAARVRAEGGTVVATGGCFDLLHAGHVGMLEAAARLGDCLVVCLNSDTSVRRLKGDQRPLQRQEDRVAVLRSLHCVDAVAVFDDDTPIPVLRELRPHVFAKGGDYAAADLPETAAVAEWGGQAVALPYLPGRSTTRLIDLVHARPAT